MHKCGLPLGFLVVLLTACAGGGGAGGSAGAKGMADPHAFTARQAAQHIGAQATVCGKVASAHYAADVEGKPTFIDLGKPYPNAIFTIVIWGDYRDRFSRPPETWHGRVCATGLVSTYHDEPQIVVIRPAQISR